MIEAACILAAVALVVVAIGRARRRDHRSQAAEYLRSAYLTAANSRDTETSRWR